MNFLKSMCNFRNKQKTDKTDTNNAVEFIWESDYTVVNCLWKIYSVFKEFGDIKNIDLFKMQPPLSRLFTVEFKTHQEAAAVLLKSQIKIDKHEIIVKPCKRAYFPSEISQKVKVDDIFLLQPPDEESPTNILNILNDDCLYEIFKRIHPSKYYIIADVCVKFNQVIAEILAKKHQKTMFRIDDLQLLTLSEADHYLRYFGSSIYQAEINGLNLKSTNKLKIKIILRMISEHCVNLRHFNIRAWELEEETVNEIIPLFVRLERLYIGMSGYFSISLPSINCPKLVAIKCPDMNVYSREIQFPSLFNFLYHNTQLTSFWYFGNARQSCKDLYLPMNNSLFGRFKSLKSLTIISCYCPLSEPKHPIDKQLLKVTELMRELTIKKVPIEILKLVHTLIDDATIEYIAQIKTMKEFIFLDYNFSFPSSCALTRDVIESYIIRLESGLPNLEFLQFQTCFYIDIVFRDEHIKLIENDLKRIRSLEPSEIKLNMHQFDRNAFNDKYNLKTIQNMYIQNRSFCINSISKVNWELKLTIRKFPATDLNVQRYWLTLCYKDEDRHSPRSMFPIIHKWSQRDFHPEYSRIF